MTAYVIQSLVLWGRETEALESVKWLGKQRNSRGGFVSTQDTVVALQALSMYSQRVTTIPLDMTVRVNLVNQPTSQRTWFSRQLGEFRIDETNKLLLQKQKVEELPSNLTVETLGSGCALVQTVLRLDLLKVNTKSCEIIVISLQIQHTGSSSKLRVYIDCHSKELFTKCLWKGLVGKN